MYGKALADFFQWRAEQGSPPFCRAVVQAHRAVLENKGYAPSTINQRLAAIKKLAREAAANGLLDASVAAAIDQVARVKQQGVRAGNWLTRPEAEALMRSQPQAELVSVEDGRRQDGLGGKRVAGDAAVAIERAQDVSLTDAAASSHRSTACFTQTGTAIERNRPCLT